MDYEKITIGDKAYRLMPEKDYQEGKCVLMAKPDRVRMGYERVKTEERYWYIKENGDADNYVDDTDYDNGMYDIGNYYNDEQLARDNARADSILWRMRQWQALNDEAVDIYNIDTSKFYLMYDIERAEMIVDETHRVIENHTVYCSTMDKAVEMCKVFEPDLMWLHTQYRRRLDESVRD